MEREAKKMQEGNQVTQVSEQIIEDLQAQLKLAKKVAEDLAIDLSKERDKRYKVETDMYKYKTSFITLVQTLSGHTT
jgi:hypothetical protein